MKTHSIQIGQIYKDARPPRRSWRVSENHDGIYTLERVDQPDVMRFVDAAALWDDDRYRPQG